MGLATIQHDHTVGGQVKDRRMWVAILDGQVFDYNLKEVLKRDLESEGHDWQVLRRHKDGTKSIVEYHKS